MAVHTIGWVDTLQPDPEAAAAFYSALFGWELDAPDAHGYRLARLRGRRVTGIGPAPERAAWATYVRVADLDAAIAAAVEAAVRPSAAPTSPTRAASSSASPRIAPPSSSTSPARGR
jgi:uncharacterized protein